MLQFAFFPYFPRSDFDKTFGRVHIFNFNHHGRKHIANVDVWTRIDELLALHQDINHNRLESPAIAVIDGNYAFEELTEEQISDLFAYSLALLLSAIVENKKDGSIYISEQFNLVVQKFAVNVNPDYNYTSFVTGSINKHHHLQSIEMTRFIRPNYIPVELYNFNHDSELMTGFANMVDAHNPDNDRCLRILEWCRYAYLNSTDYSPEIRYVMLMMAFEIFFDLPQNGKADEFAKRLESLLNVDKMLVFDKTSNTHHQGLNTITKLNAFSKLKTNTVYGWWARDFYDLRSKIVHGELIGNQHIKTDKGGDHFEIALKVLQFCFHKHLEKQGYLTYQKLSDELTVLLGEDYWKTQTENKLRKIESLI